MFRTVGDRPASWESLLPAEVLRLPEELERVDALLDDPAFFAPFARTSTRCSGGRPPPVECYLRLMFLEFRYRLGYESLSKLVEVHFRDVVTSGESAVLALRWQTTGPGGSSLPWMPTCR